MAIKQFYLHTIPILESNVLINEKVNIIDQLEDLGKPYWKMVSIIPEDIIRELDELLPRTTWSNESWKFNDGSVDNDASIGIENGYLVGLSFRSDLTEKKLDFLISMLKLCRKFKLNVFSARGEYSHPNISSVKKLIVRSSNFRYLTNPIKFFNELDSSDLIILPTYMSEEE